MLYNIIQSIEFNITIFSIALLTKKSQCFLRRFAEGLGSMLTAFGKVVKLWRLGRLGKLGWANQVNFHASGTHSGTQRPPTLITKRLINEIN
jgi:hypothetical protein